MQTARLKLTSSNYTLLEDICQRIQEVANRTGAKHSGTIPMPTKKMTVPTRKSPCGGGTESYEKWHDDHPEWDLGLRGNQFVGRDLCEDLGLLVILDLIARTP